GYYPVPAVLNPEQRKHILGVQANLWTEFISTTEYMEYMLFPRVLSLAEIAWSPLETRQVDDFKRRVDAHIRLLKQKNVNVFPLSDRVDMEMTIDTVHHQVKVALLNERHNPEIRYTVDGTEPGPKSLLYQSPIEVKDSLKIKTKVYHQDGGGDEVTVLRADNHRAIGKKVTLKNKYSSSYPAAGNGTLTDGYRGGLTYMDGRWLGFLQNLDAVIDMGEVTDISYISIKFMQLKGPGVFMPEYTVFSVSDDGETFREVIRVMNDIPKDNPNLFFKDFAASVKARGRYIKIFAKKQAGFMFTDEVVVY
ncbi:family 20 glycosylhydrolase, partial [Porphyromonadaceae bacterium OttesenSCG-928-L07]|nr:family 20 glycosylhydrolase [Porphyromonadaceae bacterium OttesenSCG-928-L07]